jgi:hypothetical protein
MISGRTLGVILTALLVACSGGGDDQSSIDAISRADAGLQLEPTVTPAPAATSQPTAPTNSVDVPPGWKQFATESISIWLPPSFEGGEPNSVDFDLALQGLELLGQEDLVEAAELSRESIVLWMFDNEPGRLGDNVNALSVPLPSAISFSAFTKQARLNSRASRKRA